jgi:hypothetical protein
MSNISNKKRKTRSSTSSIFDAVEQMESIDARSAAKKRTTMVIKDIAKSKAAQSQTKLFGTLMECRILLQRFMTMTSSSSTDDDDDMVRMAVAEAAEDDDDDNDQDASNYHNDEDLLLIHLLQARSKLMFHHDGNKNHNFVVDYSQLVQNGDHDSQQQQQQQRLRETLEREYNECRAEWEEVLNRRHRDLQLHSGLTAKSQFKVMDSSFWQQVEATVSHEMMTLSTSTSAHMDIINNNNNNNNVVYDDAKLYQHMLQDFLVLAGKAPVDSTKRFIQQRTSSNNRAKKEMDRRATKGRKIRYMVIPKLVHFTFPKERMQSNTNHGMDEEEWFKSLFGGAARNTATAAQKM